MLIIESERERVELRLQSIADIRERQRINLTSTRGDPWGVNSKSIGLPTISPAGR